MSNQKYILPNYQHFEMPKDNFFAIADQNHHFIHKMNENRSKTKPKKAFLGAQLFALFAF